MATDDTPKYATPLAWGGQQYTTFDARLDRARQDFDHAVARILETHGADPRQWPNASLDELVMHEARIDAVDKLARAANRRKGLGGFLVLDKKGKDA
jgi:hypothetical protein